MFIQFLYESFNIWLDVGLFSYNNWDIVLSRTEVDCNPNWSDDESFQRFRFIVPSPPPPPPPQLPTHPPYPKEKKRKITRPTCVNKVTPDCLLSLPFLPHRCTEFPVSSPGSCQFSKLKSKKKKEKTKKKKKKKEEEENKQTNNKKRHCVTKAHHSYPTVMYTVSSLPRTL